MDSQQLQQATSNPNIQRVLAKQASLSKRLSTAGSQFLDHHLQQQQQQHHHQQQQQQQGHASAPGASAALAPSGQPGGVGGGGGHSNTRIKMPETSYSHTETAV